MQGFNMGRYRPPDTLDNALSTSDSPSDPQKAHPLGSRARKLPAGILTVRFEMPFAIWCSTCPSHSNGKLIGQGVRFNAEKKRVGNYYSTPIWSFRMKHTACGGWIEIRTDPKESEYVVTEGAKRRDIGDDEMVADRTGGTMLLSEDEKKRQDAFEAFEGKKVEKERTKTEAMRLEELRSARERDWKDPDAANRKLRAGFRVGRKVREADAERTGELQDKMGLAFDLVAENEDDKKRASLMDFGAETGNLETDSALFKATSKPLFASNDKKTKTNRQQAGSKVDALHQTLSNNTRAAMDPFGSDATRRGGSHMIPGLKRKREGGPNDDKTIVSDPNAATVSKEVDIETPSKASGLVNYDSDSE